VAIIEAVLKVRSPVLGYNHNIQYRGHVFHVQTEDSGPTNPRIFTHLYFGGTILASKRAEYDPAAAPDIVRTLMQSQHKSILKDLKNGRHDAQLREFFAARGEELGAIQPASAAPDDDFPEVEKTPAPKNPAPVIDATPSPAAASFVEGFDDDEPTNPEERAALDHLLPTSAPAGPKRRPTPTLLQFSRGTPALGTRVRVERTVTVGDKAGATPTPLPLGPRRPARSIPYVVQEGSHPVVATPPPTVIETPTPTPAPAPLMPPPVTAQTAPITATEPDAPAAAVREESQSLDEVIMAYLSKGVDRDGDNAG
jgi:hypothetical protein